MSADKGINRIRCDRCNKWKGQSNFARKRLNDLRQKFLNNKGPFTAQCTLCVPLQLVELTCFMCGKDKGLEGFSKAQRKKADYAVHHHPTFWKISPLTCKV